MAMLLSRINNRLRTTWTNVRPVSATKVVGIGLPKTGTTSLGYSLRRLGFKHRTYDMDLAVKGKRNELDEAVSVWGKYESFADWPWFAIYRQLYQRFPGSKFIL